MGKNSAKFRIHNPSSLPIIPDTSVPAPIRPQIRRKIDQIRSKNLLISDEFDSSADFQLARKGIRKEISPALKARGGKRFRLSRAKRANTEKLDATMSDIFEDAYISAESLIPCEPHKKIIAEQEGESQARKSKDSALSSLIQRTSLSRVWEDKSARTAEPIRSSFTSHSTQDTRPERMQIEESDSPEIYLRQIDRYVCIFQAMSNAFDSTKEESLTVSDVQDFVDAESQPLTDDDFKVVCYYARDAFEGKGLYSKSIDDYDRVAVRRVSHSAMNRAGSVLSGADRFKGLMTQEVNKFFAKKKERESEEVIVEPPKKVEPQPLIFQTMFGERCKSLEKIQTRPVVACEEPKFRFGRIEIKAPPVNAEVA